MRKRNTALFIVIMLLLLGGFLFVYSRNNQNCVQASGQSCGTVSPNNQGQSLLNPQTQSSQSSSPATVNEVVVEYTDGGGFIPNSITVKQGTSVTFVNHSQRNMWVASNPHPIHTDLPGFDAKQNIGPNGAYTYTFTKVGTWGYHNHLNPAETGTVIVTQ